MKRTNLRKNISKALPKKVKMHTESKEIFVSNFLKRKKRNITIMLMLNKITDNKKLWTSVKPLQIKG